MAYRRFAVKRLKALERTGNLDLAAQLIYQALSLVSLFESVPIALALAELA